MGPVRLDRLDAVLVAAIVVLAIDTAIMLGSAGPRDHVIAPALDLVLDAVAFVVTGSIGVLSWVRYRDSDAPEGLYQASAFLTMTIADAMAVVIGIRIPESGARRPIWPGNRSCSYGPWPGCSLPACWWPARRPSAAVILVVGQRSSSPRRPSCSR